MAKKGKKYQEAASKVDRTQYYSVEEAIKLAKETSVANFDASVEVAFRLGIDTRKRPTNPWCSSITTRYW